MFIQKMKGKKKEASEQGENAPRVHLQLFTHLIAGGRTEMQNERDTNKGRFYYCFKPTLGSNHHWVHHKKNLGLDIQAVYDCIHLKTYLSQRLIRMNVSTNLLLINCCGSILLYTVNCLVASALVQCRRQLAYLLAHTWKFMRFFLSLSACLLSFGKNTAPQSTFLLLPISVLFWTKPKWEKNFQL